MHQNPTMEWFRGNKIGHGSFGSVHLAIPRSPNSPLMAVKSSPISNSDSLANEREILSNLTSCTNVIRCFGDDYSSENGDRLYNLLLEYASRGSLSDRIKDAGGKLPESDVKKYTRDIIKGLQYIHDNGFVHCDIKIQNILICSDNGNHGKGDVIKIADFGLAKKANCRDGSSSGFRGTPLNMSPESVTGGEYESPADIWSLGCTVVEMVTGKPAWRYEPGSDVNSLLFRIGLGSEIPEIPVELSDEGKDFLRKCFVRDPRMRWTAEMLLDHPFVIDAANYDDEEDYCTVPFKYEDVSMSPKCPFDFSVIASSEFETQLNGDFEFSWSELSSPDCESSPEDRLRQLVSGQIPDWSFAESWVTVR